MPAAADLRRRMTGEDLNSGADLRQTSIRCCSITTKGNGNSTLNHNEDLPAAGPLQQFCFAESIVFRCFRCCEQVIGRARKLQIFLGRVATRRHECNVGLTQAR